MLDGADPGDEVDFGWFFFAWRDREGWGLIDTGFADDEAAERFRLTEFTPAPQALSWLGLRAAQVTRVILTHAHFDHAGCLGEYPRAEVFIARAELEAMQAALAQRDWHLGYRRRELEVLRARALRQVEARARVGELELEVVGGHTPGMLAISCPEGLILAGDNAYLFANIEQRRGIGPVSRAGPDALPGLLSRGAMLVPGHDPKLVDRFPGPHPRAARLR